MKLIGLTGGIASGKSTVADYFAQKGVPVLDADQMAREVLTPPMVIENFGPEFVFTPSPLVGEGRGEGLNEQQINRKKLGAYVFDHPDERLRLEALAHPLIAQRLQEELNKLQNHEIVIYEASLIFEKNIQNMFDAVILVTAPESVRLARLLAREGMTKEEALKRMKAQMPDSEKQKLATYVINNHSNLEALHARIRAIEF